MSRGKEPEQMTKALDLKGTFPRFEWSFSHS